jgi:hypothetical protein
LAAFLPSEKVIIDKKITTAKTGAVNSSGNEIFIGILEIKGGKIMGHPHTVGS